MNFEKALELIKGGHQLTREGWNGKGMFCFLVAGSEFEVNRAPLNTIFAPGTKVTYRPHIDLKAADGSIGVWHPSMSDVMAEDWKVYQ